LSRLSPRAARCENELITQSRPTRTLKTHLWQERAELERDALDDAALAESTPPRRRPRAADAPAFRRVGTAKITESGERIVSSIRTMSLHEHRRIQERLKSVADPVGFLVNLFAHAPVGFAVWSGDGRALLTNKAFMDIFKACRHPRARF
jgi:PAS domain-containing protein